MQRHNLRAVSFVAVLAVPLILFASGSLFTRLQADDYCLMAAAQQQGVLPTVVNTYNGWSGRFTATFLTAILGLTGPGGATLLLLASLAVWAVASYGLLHESLKLVGVPLSRMWTVGAALLIITGILAALPYVEQVLYWLTGVVAYTLPLALGSILTASLAAFDVVRRQRAFAAAWDVRDAFLRTQSGAQETVRAQSFHGAMGLGDLTDDPACWVNGCIAAYYGLPAIVKDDAEPIAP